MPNARISTKIVFVSQNNWTEQAQKCNFVYDSWRSSLVYLGFPKGRVTPAKDVVQYQGDTRGL
jgi:hypothetical protein